MRERNRSRRPSASRADNHPRPLRFGLVAPAFPRVFPTRKTKSRHPPKCGRALFRSDGHTAVKHRDRSVLKSDRCCQRQRLSFIRRGDARPRLRKTKRSQRISRAAVPSKRSSPPAEKCGVCIGATPLSQAKTPENRGFGGFRDWPGDNGSAGRTGLGYGEVTPVSLITRRYFALSVCTKALN